MEIVKKKIVFAVTNDLTYDQRMIRICGSLTRAGYDVLLIGRRLKSSTPLEEKIFRQKRMNCVFSTGKLFYLEYTIRLFFFLLFHYADIYGAADTDTLMPNTLVAIIKSRKVVYDAHEYFTEVPEVTNRKFTKSIWRAIETLFIPHTSLRYTVSKSLADIFTLEYKKEFHVIRNVPVKSETTPGAKSDQPFTILYQGDLNEGRGLEEAILSMRELDAELHIAGDGPLRPDLERLIKQFNLQHKVSMLGYVKPDLLREITANASVGLNVLENKGKSYYYSLSNKFFNYIHAGIPQICADFPEYQLINSDFPVALLIPLSAEGIFGAVKTLMNDAALYDRLKNNCPILADIYNWETEEKELIRLYNEL